MPANDDGVETHEKTYFNEAPLYPYRCIHGCLGVIRLRANTQDGFNNANSYK
jgi:hypothetical protein